MDGRIAFIFPGQGAQYVGMGKAMAEKFPVVAQSFFDADAALGESISSLCFQGPEDVLRQTENTQPAIVATSVALYELVSSVVQPDMVAGHSLGEYAALVAAGSLTLPDAVRTVRKRGAFMEAAVPAGCGTMAAILGLSTEKVRDICRRAAEHGVVEPATLNGSGQVVVAGATAAVGVAARIAGEEGAKAVRMLNVSGPFHSSLMRPAGAKLAAILEHMDITPARIPVYCNTLAAPQQVPEQLKQALVDQVSTAVRWEESVQAMWQDGARLFVEIGPGRVLSGLVRRIAKDALVANVEDPESWDKFLAWAKGNGVI